MELMPVPFNRSRGYAAIGLDNPKFAVNVGGVLRAAQCFGAVLVVVGGMPRRYTRSAPDTLKAYRHLPLLHIADVMEAVPFDCAPVAIDLVDDAVPLYNYVHPKRAFYVFGAEDSVLGHRVLDKCRDRIYIPMSSGCLNLAACVNVVLYDRACKQAAGGLTIARPAGHTAGPAKTGPKFCPVCGGLEGTCTGVFNCKVEK